MEVFKTLDNGIEWTGHGETLQVLAWGPNSVRVLSRIQEPVEDSRWALQDPVASECKVQIDGSRASLTVGRLRVVLNAHEEWGLGLQYQTFRCHLRFENAETGELLFEERGHGGSLLLKAREFQALPGGAHKATLSLTTRADEVVWGMGQYQDGTGDLKGHSLELAQRNSQASVPFFLSSAGYGFLWHNPAIGRATFSRTLTQFDAEATRQLDYWVVGGDTPAEIMREYGEATGFAPEMPEYGLGFWQCKLRYWNQEQLLEVAREHRRRGLPLDVIVADYFHWPKLGDYRFEDEFWPNPKAMVDELQEMGVELMVSVWPQISHESENYVELAKNNMLVHADRGPQTHMSFEGPSAFLDVTNPRARDWLWQILKRNYRDSGIKLFWLDEAEPEYSTYQFDNYRYHVGPNVQVGNIYPQAYARAVYEGQQATAQEPSMSLLRCAWAGSQRYGALVWSGDISSTFEALADQIVAGIHMGVAGIPWWTTDIGGFHNGNIEDPKFVELLIRWLQFGAFCPVMRLHGDREPYEEVSTATGEYRLRSGADNELWAYGDEAFDVMAPYLHLREAMRSYTRDLMRQAHEEGAPVMRGLFYEFPNDPNAWQETTEYMFGAALLVAPVIEQGATTREVYLPNGAQWVSPWDGELHEGGASVTVDVPIDRLPIFVRKDREELLPAEFFKWFEGRRVAAEGS